MRFLMAEDDAVLGRAVCSYLMREGHAVDWAVTGNQVLSYLRTYTYDCVLLDLNLPELPGRDCLADARSRGNQTPVIVTTASASSAHRVDLLDIGADDFLAKPFDLHELGARVRAVVRRSQQPGETRQHGFTTYGPLTLQPNSGSVTWHGRSIPLTVKEFMVLESLLKRPNRVVQRHQLEAEVYGWNDPIESNSIEVHVHYLRRKIDPQLIQTVRGVGYQLRDARHWEGAPAPAPSTAS
jgi:two-component system, OmpR family, response regulator QseB